MDTKFLDEAIVELARGGPPKVPSPLGVSRENREAWATRIVDDALALAARRELKVLECEAVDLTAQNARGETCPAQSGFVACCEWCGAGTTHPDRTSADAASREHTRACAKHPMREVEAERDGAHAAIARLNETIDRLRSAPASVAVTDIESAVNDVYEAAMQGVAFVSDQVRGIRERAIAAAIRKHTRTWTVEEIAEAIQEAMQRPRVTMEDSAQYDALGWKVAARAVLSLLGGDTEAFTPTPKERASLEAALAEPGRMTLAQVRAIGAARDWNGPRSREFIAEFPVFHRDPASYAHGYHDALLASSPHPGGAREPGATFGSQTKMEQPSAPKRPFVPEVEQVRRAMCEKLGLEPDAFGFTSRMCAQAAITEITAQRERWEREA